MTVQAKICGVNSAAAMDAAIAGGAEFVGLVFYPPSPRYVAPDEAKMLATRAPASVRKVGLFVDEGDDTFEAVLSEVALDMVQLHGGESPARVREITDRFGLPAIKAIKLAGTDDLAVAENYFDIADWLLFDAMPPADMAHALPGGNALAFDWRLLAGRDWPLPWMLSGGLDAGNVAEAVAISGAATVDVSSGVEDGPGRKSPAKMAVFLKAVAAL